MQVSTDITLPVGDTAGRARARERLYVVLQTFGWGIYAAVGIWLSLAFPSHENARPWYVIVSYNISYCAGGLLFSHMLRPLMTKRKWKQLGWKALFPRIIGLGFLGGVFYGSLFCLWVYGVTREPWPEKISASTVVLLDSFYSGIVFCSWLGVYYFYHLFDRLNRSEIERFQLMTNVKEAELRALKSQVNPHFIFNSLNSLRALIDEDPGRARKAVTQLANLLRYSLQSGQLETVPLEDELGVVNDYLALEQIRFEERLRLRLDIAPGALPLRIPPMLLQTLVENAVKYGIAPNPDGGEITIAARNEGGVLRILVSNPGEVRLTGPAGSTGVGLHNAAERLRLIFGEKASLRLLTEKPARVVAEAVIPLASHS